jgi:hypothetical protein
MMMLIAMKPQVLDIVDMVDSGQPILQHTQNIKRCDPDSTVQPNFIDLRLSKDIRDCGAQAIQTS